MKRIDEKYPSTEKVIHFFRFSSALGEGYHVINFLWVYPNFSSKVMIMWSQIVRISLLVQFEQLEIVEVTWSFISKRNSAKQHEYAPNEYLLQILNWTKNWTPSYNLFWSTNLAFVTNTSSLWWIKKERSRTSSKK